jgi:hypothetical protein
MSASSSQKWPTSRVFVMTMRELERKRRYVPPYQQPAPVTPLAAALPTAAQRQSTRDTGQRYGSWRLTTNDHGDLIAVHDSGVQKVIAAVPDSESEDNDG